MTDVTRWWAAVELGARGRAAAARTELNALDADPGTAPAVRSLAHSTRGSLTRQAGGHAVARAADGAACALVATAVREGGLAGRGWTSAPWTAAAWADGLIGLAADALGIGDFRAADTLLGRTESFLDSLADDPAADWRTLARVRLRATWVRTEWALYSGRIVAAQAQTGRLQSAAAAVPSRRHRLKTTLILAAIAAASDKTGDAVALAEDSRRRAAAQGALPLLWAAESMLMSLSPYPQDMASDVRRLRDELALRGMPFAPLRPGERHGR